MFAFPTIPRWTLDDLLPGSGDAALQHVTQRLESAVAAVEADRARLAADMAGEDFLAILQRYEELAHISRRLGAYSALLFSEDTQNPAALNLRGKVEQLLTQAANRTLFLSLWFKALPDESAARLMQNSGDLRYYLESWRRFKPFTLSEVEEKLINVKDVNGIDALVKVYEIITNSFAYELEVDGERKTLTRDQLMSYARTQSPDLRAAAYRELYRVYGEHSLVLAQIYSHRVGDWKAEAVDMRGYAQPLSVRNLGNDLPDAVVDTLLSVCRQNAGLFQRYFRIKARYLGMDKLRRYDIYAPFARSEKRYTFQEGADMMFASLGAFSPRLEEAAKSVFLARHVDAEPRHGKRGGAFCFSAVPTVPPYVLTNFTGQARDVATLAHEMGHAVHAVLSNGHSVLTWFAPLPMAETASVFSEILLMQRLLKDESDPAVRRDILGGTIDDAYGTVMRQAYFTLFERDAHRMIAEGSTFDDVAQHYMENLGEQFGDAVELSDEFRWEWVSIPHFYYTPFYTYAYSFGQLLVLALYQQYLSEGESFVPRYINILAAGGSRAPMSILQEAGLDVTDPAFWQGGFEVVEGMVDELDKLT
jgi:oligoendopeptidase F